MPPKQAGFALYAILGLTAALGVVGAWGMYQKAKISSLEAEARIWQANYEDMKQTAQEQVKTISEFHNLQQQNVSDIREVYQEIDRLHVENLNYQKEIDAIRATEFNRAIQAPFDSGNAARDRVNVQLRRFAGEGAGGDDPDTP